MAVEKMNLDQALDRLIGHIETRYGQPWLLFDGHHWAKEVKATRFGFDRDYEKAIAPDAHPFTEIFLGVSGRCALSVAGRIVRVAPGDALIILPGIVHCEMPSRKDQHIGIWITLDNNRCVMHLSGKDTQDGFYTIAGHQFHPDHYSVLFSYTRRELAADHLYNTILIKSYLLQMLVHARRELKQDADGPDNHWAQSVTAEVRHFVDANLSRPIRLEDISREVCLSANHLSTLFKKTEGCTVASYIAEQKLERAKHLLLSTDASVKEIAARLGFYDSYHFSKMFKKATQVSPSAFRKT